MPKIAKIRPVLLSGPYADPDNAEVKIHLRSGYKTCGLVEITLDDGTTGLGEAYLAVFAPQVFVEITKLIEPFLLGKDAFDTAARYRDICAITDYWSLQGAARHVVSAFEIALIDAKGKALNIPAYALLGGKSVDSIKLYGSGGNSVTPQDMHKELNLLGSKQISLFKIRVRQHQVNKTAWALNHAGKAGIDVAVDMGQNLVNPSQTVSEVVKFIDQVYRKTENRIAFLEEALGPMDIDSYPLLRRKLSTKVCGGEIITTAEEMCRRVENGLYDFVQPDATVIGGIYQVLEVFATCRQHGSTAVVHCWGGGVGMMANYHAAFAGGGQLAEWPIPSFSLRDELYIEPLEIKDGSLLPPRSAGLGVRLTPELEEKYAFREDATYVCPDDRSWVPPTANWESSG